MTREEWAMIAVYIQAAIGKEFGEQQLEVYFDLLGDLPAGATLAAAKAVLGESVYPTLPTPGAIRSAAVAMVSDGTQTAAEAWRDVVKAVRRYGYNRPADGLATLEARARNAAECIGWQDLCNDLGEVTRAHFFKAYEQLSNRDRREALIPVTVRRLMGTEKPFQFKLIGKDTA